MGRKRHYRWEVEDLIGHLLGLDYSLPEAIKILGGRPCERTVRCWIARRNPMRFIYLENHHRWKCARFTYPGILKDYAEFQERNTPEASNVYGHMMGGMIGMAKEEVAGHRAPSEAFGTQLVDVILHGMKLKRGVK